MNRRVLGVLTLVVLTLVPAQAALAQSLAEAAKQEQARRKKAAVKGPTKVFTETDIKPAPSGGSEPDAATPAPGAAAPARQKPRAKEMTPEELKAHALEEWRKQEASLKAQIAQAAETVRELGSHPTGGGKVCKIDESAFQPGVTAPEQVVCPAQMESRYDVAKRELDKVKSELAQAENSARRAGLIR